MFMQPTIVVFGQNMKRNTSNALRSQNIYAARTIAELIRTNLGPQAMYKMLMDPMGGVCMTNDGNAILREIIVQHPVAKMLIEVARTQDEEVGDGTTSVIILCGQILTEVEKYLDTFHPVVIIRELRNALDDILRILPEISKPIDLQNTEEVYKVVKATLGTKFLSAGWSKMLCELAIKAVEIVRENEKDRPRMDFRSFARIEKIPGGTLDDTQLIEGVVIDKDVLHPKMRRLILKPRILLLCSGLEYRKGESVTNVEMSKETDYTRMLQIEEEHVAKMCAAVLAVKPDLVLTEKGMSDLAVHYFAKAGVTALRRVKKMDIIRLSRVSGASIMSRPEEVREKDLGTRAGKFEVRLIGDEYFSFVTDCREAKACTLLLRGPSKDLLHEMERNLQDAMSVIRCLYSHPRVVPGGGGVEMALYSRLTGGRLGLEDSPYSAVPAALRVIPRTLLENAGASPLRGLSELERDGSTEDIRCVDGVSGQLVAASELGVWEPEMTKSQVLKSAVETAIQVLKIDEVVSGVKSRQRLDEESRPQQQKAKGKPGQPDEKGQGDVSNQEY